MAFALLAPASRPAPARAAELQPPRFTREQMEAAAVESGAKFRVVYGTRDPALEPVLRARGLAIARRLFGADSSLVRADREVAEAFLTAGPVLLLGGPRENTWTQRLAAALPVQFTATGFRWQGTPYEREGDALSLSYPLPLAAKQLLLVIAANSAEAYTHRGILFGDEDWRIVRNGELVRSGTFAQEAARPWRYVAARDRDRDAERVRWGAALLAHRAGPLTVRAAAGLAVSAAAERDGAALLARMDAMRLNAARGAGVTLTLYRTLEEKGVLTRSTRPEHLDDAHGAHAALAAGRATLDLWSVAAARLCALGASDDSRLLEPAGAWLTGRLEGEALECAVSRLYFSRALPTVTEAATRAPDWRSPLVWVPARALLVRAVWESAPPLSRRASLLALLRRDPPGTLDSLCRAASVSAPLVRARYQRLADSLARGAQRTLATRQPRPWRPADGFQRGVCLAHAVSLEGGYASAVCERELRTLRETGANWISVTPFGYLSDAHTPQIYMSGSSSPEEESDEAICEVAARARALGLRVWLKPHLWTRGWVGELSFSPTDWPRFFDRYRECMLHWALLAERERMDGLFVGHELASATARDPSRWRALIGEVRRVYTGTLAYNANWDEATRIEFWDALDLIAVSFYSPLAAQPTRDPAVLRAGANKALAPLRTLAQRFGRPVLLAEVGYTPSPMAPVRPWEEPRSVPDMEAQKACYQAVIAAMDRDEWLAGTFWWKWFTSPEAASGPQDGSFSPRGKPAETVMRAALKAWDGRPVRVPAPPR